MALTASLTARQQFAAAPVQVHGVVTSDNPNVDLANNPFVFVGVTAAAGAPATYGGLAAHDDGGTTNDVYSTPLWDSMLYAQNLSSAGGVAGPNKVVFTVDHFMRLGTFSVGQYLWLWVSAGAAYPVGGDAPAALGGPYLIV